MSNAGVPKSQTCDQDDVLLGIVMLAVVNAMWQRDFSESDIDGNIAVKNIFSVDTDIVNFFSQPASKTKYMQLPGLLGTPDSTGRARAAVKVDYPEALAQIMGRYIFSGSEHLGSKLMFPSTLNEVNRMVDIVREKAFEEIDKTHQKMISAQTTLNYLVSAYFREKESTLEKFFERFLTKMDKLYPAIFSDGAVREFKRLGDLFNPDRKNFRSPHDLIELDQALRELESEKEADVVAAKFPPMNEVHHVDLLSDGMLPWRILFNAWMSAIDSTIGTTSASPQRSAKAKVDAEALATIEWCNRWLSCKELRYRIVFVTGAERLYGAARLRWGLAKSHQLQAETLARIKQGADVFCYYADVLLSESDGSTSTHRARLAEQYAPLRDVRYFLADPAFLRYAQDNGENGHSLVEATLTEWLQAFLLRMNKEDHYIGRNFLALSGMRRFPDSKAWQPISLQKDSQADVREFETKWQGFLRQASFNHLIDSGIKRRSLKVLIDNFAAFHKNEKDAHRILLDLLHEAHVDVSRAATNLSLAALASNVPMDRCVPPLVLRRFPDAQKFVSVLLKELVSPKEANIRDHLKTLKNMHFGEGVGAKREYTKKYLDLLLRAYCFAIFREWKGALFLAKEAYLVTQLQVHRDCRQPDEAELAGREAAYLACVASRHAENFNGLTEFDKQCFDWADRLEKAVEADDKPPMPQFAIEIHRARTASENLAHELMYRFYSKWSHSQDAEPLTTEVVETLNESLEHLVAELEGLTIGTKIRNGDLNEEHRELHIAWLYILRQTLVNLAQTRHLLANSEINLTGKISTAELAQLLEDANRICRNYFPDTLPESDLHRYILALLHNINCQLDTKSCGKIRSELMKKINEVDKCPWALAYDGEKYKAILRHLTLQE
jgi:hypothetical protein